MSTDVNMSPERAQDLATALPAGSPERIDRDPSSLHTRLSDVAAIESAAREQQVDSRQERDERPEACYVDAGPTLRRSELDAAVVGKSPALATAVLLHERGLHPVGLYPRGLSIIEGNTNRTRTTSGKEPILIGWDRRPDAAALTRVWKIFPGAGVGLVLGLVAGLDGGVIDFEIDDPILADLVLKRIFGAEGPPATLGWESNRGRHWLYRITDAGAGELLVGGIVKSVKGGLNTLGRVVGNPHYLGVEARLGTIDRSHPRAEQSAIPPTAKADGTPRTWEGEELAYFPRALIDDLLAYGVFDVPEPPVGEPLPREQLAGLTPLDKFTAQLGAMNIDYNRSGEQGSARCPTPGHVDSNPSLTFGEADDGRLLLTCHGCNSPFGEIMRSVGLEERDAYPDVNSHHRGAIARPSRGARLNLWASEHHVDAWTARSEHFQRALADHPEKLELLARRLGVGKAALLELEIGWREDKEQIDGVWVDTGRFAWTFPEHDGRGLVVGILRRYENETIPKRAISGSKRGLYIPDSWLSLPGPIYVVEGMSDVAAAIHHGHCAIGRPSASGGGRDLVELLREDAREIVVMGENDQKPSGAWPGRDGMDSIADELSNRLSRPVKKMLPPLGYKDFRAFLNSGVDTMEVGNV